MKSLQIIAKNWLLLLLAFSWTAIASAQRDGGTVTKQNGILVFSDKGVFESTLNQLRQNVQNFDFSTLPDEQPTNYYLDPMPPLATFEQSLGFTSLRQVAQQRVYSNLTRGIDSDIETELVAVDEILGAMLSPEGLVKVGSSIYLIESDAFNYEFPDAELSVVDLIRGGNSPLSIPGVIIYKGDAADGTCSADFLTNGFNNSTTGTFIYAGSPALTEVTSLNWYFGDGTTSTAQNPTHTYASYGTYQVCLQIQTKDNCSSQICKTINISQTATCQATFIWNKTGAPGTIAFLDYSTAGTGTITAWSWDFGDGTTANVKNPTHTFPCDKTYFVSLTVTTNQGCSNTITLPVEVSSYNCCERWAKLEGFHDYTYNGTQYRFHYKAKHVNLPLLRYVHTSMRHARKGFAGIYWWSKANLAISLRGQVYTPDERGCTCQTLFNINADDAKYGFWLIEDKSVGNPFKAKKADPWNCSFKVTDRNVNEFQVIQVGCD